MAIESTWGRVDDNNVVSVRDGQSWRDVGQYPDVSAEEALAYFTKKFDDLAAQVSLLEARVKRSAPAKDIAQAAEKLAKAVSGANAVGDLAGLSARLERISGQVAELNEAQKAQLAEAKEKALAERERIVTEIEALAAADSATKQWKAVSATVDRLFSQWQEHQKNGPQLPKSVADELWKRFRAARSTLDSQRRAFFSELDSLTKEAKSQKQRLISEAQALLSKGADAVPAYRALLDKWKTAPRAAKKLEDGLWAEFKAVGDALYAAKSEVDKVVKAEFSENLARKEALLSEARHILSVNVVSEAKKALRDVQRQWDEIGKVPREAVKKMDDGIRALEQHVRSLEQQEWAKADPEKKARAEGMAGQLQKAIAALETDLAAAEKAGDATKAAAASEALAARRAWLAALEN